VEVALALSQESATDLQYVDEQGGNETHTAEIGPIEREHLLTHYKEWQKRTGRTLWLSLHTFITSIPSLSKISSRTCAVIVEASIRRKWKMSTLYRRAD